MQWVAEGVKVWSDEATDLDPSCVWRRRFSPLLLRGVVWCRSVWRLFEEVSGRLLAW